MKLKDLIIAILVMLFLFVAITGEVKGCSSCMEEWTEECEKQFQESIAKECERIRCENV